MWLYQGKEFTTQDINDHYGFVYLITDTETGRKYIGRKTFWSKRTLPPLKGKTQKRKVVTESDWQSYHGSNAALKELVAINGPDGFSREILHLCRSSSECSYFEAKLQFEHDALIRDDYFNDWIMCRVSRSHVKKLKCLNTSANHKENDDDGSRTIC